MYQLNVNDKYNFEINRDGDGLLINGLKNRADIKQIRAGVFHVIDNNRSYNVEVVNLNTEEKTAEIRINNNTYHITAKDEFDVLLDKMGLSNLTTAKVSELKAPMPGMVLKILVAEGDAIQKGDNLFILEAMKMENIIKAPADVTIGKVLTKAGDKVEKGQILIRF